MSSSRRKRVLNSKDNFGRTPAITSILYDNKVIYKAIVRHEETDLHCQDYDGVSLVVFTVLIDEPCFFEWLMGSPRFLLKDTEEYDYSQSVLPLLFLEGRPRLDLLKSVLNEPDVGKNLNLALLSDGNQTLFHRLASLPPSSLQLECATLLAKHLRVKGLLRQTLCVQDVCGDTCFHRCCENNLSELLQLLLIQADKCGVKQRVMKLSNYCYLTALHVCCLPEDRYEMASSLSRLRCCEVLVEFGARIDYSPRKLNTSPLTMCVELETCSKSQEQVACYLIDCGADVHTLKNPHTSSILGCAVTCGAVRVVNKLLTKKFFDVNAQIEDFPFKALDIACVRFLEQYRRNDDSKLPSTKMIETLLKFGADPGSVLVCLSQFGNSFAAKKLLVVLLELGCNPNCGGSGRLSLLMRMIVQKDVAMVMKLVESGADLDFEYHRDSDVTTSESYRSMRAKGSDRFSNYKNVRDFCEQNYREVEDVPGVCEFCSRCLSEKDGVKVSVRSLKEVFVCTQCQFFNEDKGLTVLGLARRLKHPEILRYISFARTSLGRRMVAQGFGEYIRLFVSVCNSEIICKKLRSEHLKAFGISDPKIVQKLLVLFRES